MNTPATNESCRSWLERVLKGSAQDDIALPQHLSKEARTSLWLAIKRYQPALAALLQSPHVKETQQVFGGSICVRASDLRVILKGLKEETKRT